MDSRDVDADMSRRPCERGGWCEGSIQENAVRCRKCRALHGFIRGVVAKPPGPKPTKPRK